MERVVHMVKAGLFMLSSLVVGAPVAVAGHAGQIQEFKPNQETAFPIKFNKRMQSDGFGTLPSGLTAEMVIAAIAPEQNPGAATLVGAEAWSGHKNRYLAIACFRQAPPAVDRRLIQGSCEGSGKEGHLVYVGLLEYQGVNHSPRVVARHYGPLEIAVDFGEGGVLPDGYIAFEGGPLKISENYEVFGLRFGWECGASEGAFAYWEGLALFKVDSGRLTSIFSELMYSYIVNVETCENSSCDYEISESKSFLSVSNIKTDGFYNLIIGNSKYLDQVEFVWSKETGRYFQKK